MSINLLNNYIPLNMKVSSVSVTSGINTNNSSITNVADGVADGDAVNMRQLRQLQYVVPTVVTVNPMSSNYDVSTYTMANNNSILVLNPTSDYYVKLPNPVGLDGFMLSIIDDSSNGSTISLCTDDYVTSLKDIASGDNGIKVLAVSGKYIFLLL